MRLLVVSSSEPVKICSWLAKSNKAAQPPGPGLGSQALSVYLAAHREQVNLYRRLTTLRTEVPLAEGVDDLEWCGAYEGTRELCMELGANDIPDRIPRWLSES